MSILFTIMRCSITICYINMSFLNTIIILANIVYSGSMDIYYIHIEVWNFIYFFYIFPIFSMGAQEFLKWGITQYSSISKVTHFILIIIGLYELSGWVLILMSVLRIYRNRCILVELRYCTTCHNMVNGDAVIVLDHNFFVFLATFVLIF